jgi:hypothetical protein
MWLSNKLTQEFPVSYEKTVSASRKALQSLNLSIIKEEQTPEVTQLRSENTDGKDIWIDIRKVTEQSTKVEVRVGAVSADKETASAILKKIQHFI